MLLYSRDVALSLIELLYFIDVRFTFPCDYEIVRSVHVNMLSSKSNVVKYLLVLMCAKD